MTLISFIEDRPEVIEDKRLASFGRNFTKYCLEFTNNTTIHGLKYMGERKRSLIEKFWWLVLFLVSLSVCVILIINTWIKWDQSPVLLSFAQIPAKVWQIPFPAVTICPENKIDSTIYNYSSNFYNKSILSNTEYKKFCQASFMCGYPIDDCVKTKDDIIVDAQFATKIGPNMEKSLAYCMWKYTLGCEHLFSPVIINNGLCFTFNMLDKKELLKDNYFIHHKSFAKHRNMTGWSPEEGYYGNPNDILFPRRALLAESSESLTFSVVSNKESADFMCSKATEGFKLYLHHPSEIPGVGIHYLRIPMDKVVDVVIKPNMIYSSEELKSYRPSRRKCYMAREKNLQFFKIYNKQNCLTECIANYTLKTCGCAPYYMPHEQSTQLCGLKDYICIDSIEQTLLTFDIQSSYNKSYEDPLTQCDCLPSCSTLKYEAEISQTDLSFKMPGNRMSRIKIFFKDMEFIPIERKELFGTTDFWANCGGLLGLFMGFSLLSLIEMIYFFTLRLMCNLKQYGRDNWSGSNI